MGTRELKAVYAGNPQMAINRAIRAELAAGSEALDAMELFHKLVRRLGEIERNGQPTLAKVAYDRIAGVCDAMEAEIRKRYGMNPIR